MDHSSKYFSVFILILTILASVGTHAQTRISLTASQTMADDWKRGEMRTIEMSNSFDTRQQFRIDTLRVSLSFKYAIGVIYEKSNSHSTTLILPTDNILSGEAVLKYPIGWKLDPFFSASFNTQLTESFKKIKDQKKGTAKLWDPVISFQSWGFAYLVKGSAKDKLESRLGFSLKQIRTTQYPALADDRKTRDIVERYKAESGIQWKTESYVQLDSSTNYRSSLDLYSSFDDLAIWAIIWDNEIQISIWEVFAVVLKVDVLYDETISFSTQYKQSFRFGVVANI